MNKKLLDFITEKKHHEYRRDYYNQTLCEDFKAQKLDVKERMTRRFELLADFEIPVLLPEEKICFLRTVKDIPDIFTKDEWEEIRKKHFIHELGYMSNLSPDYEGVIADGLLKRREFADSYGKRTIDAIIALADRYKKEAEAQGKIELAAVLERVPRYGATNFYEALQFFRIIHFSLWLEGNYHNTVGRFDKYMYPYLKADMEKGLYTKETALEMIEDFFISFNKDSDLYVGVQQGDNGQSIVLGGVDENGEEVFNLLSELCITASRNLLLIDPKINLRVNSKTPLRIFELGTELTKAGLGFPQYSNDDIVIEGLCNLGYDLKDARNYVVAACWEFIIPKFGADVANIGALSFPKVIDIAVHKHLCQSETFEDFMEYVKEEVATECENICSGIQNLWFVPSPFMSVMMGGKAYDGAKYNNFGIHGTGIATAADSLAVIEKYIYNDKTVTKEQLTAAVDSDYTKHSELLALFRYETPKMGNNDDFADEKASKLLEIFASSLEGKVNCRGGKFRAGTGSAMFYLWHANEIGASPDGRRKGEPFGTNYSPSLFARIGGPLSVIQSFTKQRFTDAINGGPLTLEFVSSMFEGEDGIKKVAALVKTFVEL